jgi:hypothetical protein
MSRFSYLVGRFWVSLMAMKPSISNALHVINRASAEIIEQIECLRDEGVLTPHFAEVSILGFKQRFSEVNVSTVHRIAATEIAEAAGYEKSYWKKRKNCASNRCPRQLIIKVLLELRPEFSDFS